MNARVNHVVLALFVSTSILLQSCISPVAPIAPAINSSASPQSKPPAQLPFDTAKRPGAPANAEGKTPATLGKLVLPAELDGDNDETTNPRNNRVVPVAQFQASKDGASFKYATIKLGVVVTPDDANRNPSGTAVDFHAWSDHSGLNITHTATADVWGAATSEIVLDDRDLYDTIHYTVHAEGYSATQARQFHLNPAEVRDGTRMGYVSASATVDSQGRVSIDIQSDAVINVDAMAAQVIGMRLTAKSAEPDKPDYDLLPPIVAERVDDHHARAVVYLDKGEYAFIANIRSGQKEDYSEAALAHVTNAVRPQIDRLDNVFDADDKAQTAMVQYYAPNGDAAIVRMGAHEIEALQAKAAQTKPTAGPRTFSQVMRVGPFKYFRSSYALNVQTQSGDGKKVAFVDGFKYDPIARTYAIKVQSLLTQTISDKLTVQALGSNGVVIYEETAAITLDPSAPLQYQFTVPAKLGEPKGLRITVHDPFFLTEIFNTAFDFLIDLSLPALTSVFNYLREKLPVQGFEITSGYKLTFKIAVVELAVLNIRCQFATGCIQTDKKGILFKSGFDIFSTVTDGVRDYIRGLRGAPDNPVDYEKFLKKLIDEAFPLGSIGLVVPLNLTGRKNYINPGSCPSKPALDAATKSIKGIGAGIKTQIDYINYLYKSKFESSQPKGLQPTSLIPQLPIVKFFLKPVFTFKLGGGSTEDDLGLFLDVGLEVGFSGGVALGLPKFAFLDLIQSLYDNAVFISSIIEGYKQLESLYKLVKSATEYTLTGGCNTPGGGGSSGAGGPGKGSGKGVPYPSKLPDDRQDASDFDTPLLPTGITGDLQYLNDHIQLAQSLQLNRAVTYYTFLLRQKELSEFEADTTRELSATLELSQTASVALNQVQGILSGTIPITPGVTITDAAQAVFDTFLYNSRHRQYDIDRKALIDTVAFAERQYNLLLGQELELALEIGKLDNYGVGVLDEGIGYFTQSAFGSLGLQTSMIQLFPGARGVTRFGKYVSPFSAPPVVVIPSGGLNAYQGVPEARTWLEQYTAAGGTLIVLAQYENDDWNLLPGGQVRGLGYKDDILCKDASVRLINPSQFTVGIDHDLPNIQIDGSFTQLPTGTTVVLMRTTGNQLPAMIEYPFGLGRVIATSAFPDFYINGQQSLDDIAFARSLFGVAFLKATGKQLAASVPTDSIIQFNADVKNTSPVTVTSMLVLRDYYEARIGDSWRWAAHAPSFRTAGTTVQPLNPPLAPGEARSVALSFLTPPQAGLYRASIELRAVDGRYSFPIVGTIPTDLYQARGSAVAVDLFNTTLQVSPFGYVYGSQATVTATLRNDRASARTVVLSTEVGLPNSVVTVTIPANSTATQMFSTAATSNKDVRIVVNENGNLISTLFGTVRIRRPSVFMTLTPDRIAPGIAATLAISVAAADVAANTPVRVQVTNGATVLYSDTRPLAQIGPDKEILFSAPLPTFAPSANVKVMATLLSPLCDALACFNTQTLRVGKANEVVSLSTNGPITLGVNAPNALNVGLSGNGFDTAVQLRADVSVGNGAPVVGDVTSAHMDNYVADAQTSLALPAVLPPNTFVNINVIDTSTAAGASQGYSTTRSVYFSLLPGSPSLLGTQLRAHDTLAGSFPALRSNSTDGFAPDVRLPADAVFNFNVTGPDGSTFGRTATPIYRNGRYEFSFDLPSLAQGDYYLAELRIPALGSGYSSLFSFDVPPQHLVLDAPATANAGSVLNLSVRNTGGVDTFINGTLSLRPAGEAPITTTGGISIGVPTNGATPFAYTLPSQLASGPYVVQIAGVDHLNQPVTITARINIGGVNATLDVRTDRFAYLNVDPVSTHNIVNTNVPLDGATLRLRVIRPAGTATPTNGEDWTSDLANAGHVNYNNNTLGAPLDPAWSAAHYPYIGNPLSVNGLVIAADVNTNKVRALNTNDGQVSWETDLSTIAGFGLSSIAANGTKVFVLFGQKIAALDASNGNILWVTNAGGNFQQPLYATETALVVWQSAGGGNLTQIPGKGMSGVAKSATQVSSVNGFILLDPATGAQRGAVPTSFFAPALLVNDTLVYADANSQSVIAFNAVTGAGVWSTPVTNGYSLTPVAGNAQFAVFRDNNDSTLKAFNFGTGALAQTIAADAGFNPGTHQSAILNGATLTYAAIQFGSGGNGVALYRVNLSDGTQSPIFNSSINFAGMAGVGSNIVVLQTNPQAAHILGANGTEQSALDLSALPDLLGVIASRRGLIFNSSTGIAAYNAPGGSTGGSTAEAVLLETLVAVNGNSTIMLDQPLANLGANPQARGALVLDGALFSKEPVNEPDLSKHIALASSRYGFVIETAASALTLSADQTTLHANRAGYAPDDAISMAILHGEARNTSALAASIVVTVTRSDNAVIFNQTFAAVAPGASVPFTVTDANAPVGTISYNASSNLGGAASAQIQVRAGNIAAAAQFDAASLVLGQSVNLNATLQNVLTDTQAVVSIDWSDGANETFVLRPAQTINVNHVYTPTVAGNFAPNIVLTGDANGAINIAASVQVRDESATAAASTSGRTRGSAIVRTDAAALSLALTNAHAYTVPVQVDYVLNSNPITGSQLFTLAPNSAQTLTLPLKALDAGNHTAVFTVKHAQLGTVLAVVNLAFALVDPVSTLQLQTNAGVADVDGNVPIIVVVSSDATNDDNMAGTVVVSGAVEATQPFALAPGQSLTLTPTLALAGHNGVQTVNVQVLDAAGHAVRQSAVQVQAAPRPAPNAKLLSLTADPASAGGTVTLHATVRNDGSDGDVTIEFNAFEGRTTATMTIPANATRELSATLPVPGGILQGTYPAFAKLDDQNANADVAVSAPQIALDLSLDKTGYLPNTNGTVRARLRGVSGTAQQYDVSFRYRTGENMQTVTLGAGDTRDVSWSFDVGQESDRLNVIVSNHTATATAPRYSIAIDSIHVNVIEDDRAWIESDKKRYNVGDVVRLTLHALKPINTVMVLAPSEIPDTDNFIVWSSLSVLSATGTLTNVVGDYSMMYRLPTVLPTGRYYFTLSFNGEERYLPVDVLGINLDIENLRVTRGASPSATNVPLTIRMILRSNVTVPQARVSAFALAPDGSVAQLGTGADMLLSLAQGATQVQLTGALNATMPGAYRIIVRVHEAGSYTYLVGASAFVNVGGAVAASLTTDHGVYAPGQSGRGTFSVYGTDASANIRVTTSGGAVVLNSTRALTGFAQLTFTVPTAVLGDEVLIGTVTSSDGLTSTVQAAYRVASSFDVTAPVVRITSPATQTVSDTVRVLFNGPASHTLNVSGQIDDVSRISSVLVNGVSATVSNNASDASFSASIPITRGINYIDVSAQDAAGNIGFTSLELVAEPSVGLTLTASPASAYNGQRVVYRAVLTATELVSGSVSLYETDGLVRFTDARVSTGVFSGVVSSTSVITWLGQAQAGTPVEIVLTGTVVATTSAGTVQTSTVIGIGAFDTDQPVYATVNVRVVESPSTPTPTKTATSTPTSTPTTPTKTNTPTPSSTPTPSPTPTKTPTPSPSPTPTSTGNVDLSILLSDGGIPSLPGGVTLYAMAFANTSAVTATNVKITETVPANTRFVLAQSALGWSCADGSAAGSACMMNVGTLAPGARGSAVFAVLHTGSQSPVVITDTVRIGSAQADVNPANNTASVSTPLILPGGSDISPILECVMDRGASVNPRYTAVFGYNNPNAFAKIIGLGNSNKFAPSPGERGQPVVFLPGRRRNAFFVDFNSGTLVWALGSKTVTAASNSTPCASTTKIVSGVAWLDSNGNGLRDSTSSEREHEHEREPGLPLVFVNLVDASGSALDTRLTSFDGTYSFVIDNPAGKFVQVIRPPLTNLKFTARDANASTLPGNDANDSAIDPVTWRTLDLGTLPNPLRGSVRVGVKP